MLVGYARVSALDENPAFQIDALEAAGCERIFKEAASGANRDRPALRSAIDYVRAGDTLVIWKLDRLARSTRQLIETAGKLAECGIGLKVLDQEAIDTTTSSGWLVYQIFGALTEFERALTLERTRAGLAAARACGRVGGRRPALGPADICRAKAMLADPLITVEEVAHQLGVTQSTLYRHIPGGRSSLIGQAA